MSVPAAAGYTPPSVPLRTKRNFKALVLPDDPIAQPGDPVATRPAPQGPVGASKRRPPPLGGDNDTNGFVLDPTIPLDSPATGRRSGLISSLAKLDLKKKVLMNASGTGLPGADGVPRLDLKSGDLKKLADLGHGNGGSVEKVEHVPTGTLMAKKIVLIDAKSSVRKQILRELQIMHECQSEYIISCYGSFLAEPNICICMEYMDKGSFDGIYRKIGAIDIDAVCLVAQSVLEGLTYLYDVHRIIHRDIKPSNILLNSNGSIKLCDFGVSGELINSIANTFVGTSIYMSPERIQGAEYSVKSDIWSLGITLVELATGRFPFADSLSDDEEDGNFSDLDEDYASALAEANKTPTHRDSFALDSKKDRMKKRMSKRKSKGGLPDLQQKATVGGGMGMEGDGGLGSMSIIELMHQIVREPAPRIGSQFSEEAQEFVDACLEKDPDERHSPKTLLEYRWMDDARDSTFDLKAWTSTF